MAEPYTDDECYALEVPSLDERIWKTLFRLQRERDDAKAESVRANGVSADMYHDAIRERDEARRVAKVLAQRTTASQHDWAEVMTALAYPEVEP